VLILGLVGLGTVAWMSGTPVPIPWSPWAPVLGVCAAVAEEALFRRLAYGRLLRFGAPVAIVGSALAFALLHVPLYGVAVLPIDLGAGLLLSWQRWASGTWTVPAATHAAANLLAVIR
jgi:membrane protease YdiL (CAAX protease family)